MRVCVVNSSVMARAFTALGHEVLALSPGPGPVDLPGLLDGRGFEPELLLDVESLGLRTLLLGLGSLSCAKLFWSVDTHLNAWWHRAYGRMFDAVLTTQDAWMPRLLRLGLPVVEHLPWFGLRRPFRPWRERATDLRFVGRISPERPTRVLMVEHLRERHGLDAVQDVSHAAMLDLYDDTRLVPNEAIFSEVNFRLFEAASCGCLVLNQSVSSDIALLFKPGREVLVFEDILELDSLVRRWLARPAEAEAMARAAWARVNAEHLPEHRARRVLELAGRHAGKARRGGDAPVWEALYRMNEAGTCEVAPVPVLAAMAERCHEADGLAALLRALFFWRRGAEALSRLEEILARASFARDFELNFTASVLGLRLGRMDLALAFWLRHALAAGLRRSDPATPAEFWMAWAKECERHWLPVNSGFSYAVGSGLPQSAYDCLQEAVVLEIEDQGVMRRMSALLAEEGSGAQGLRLRTLSYLGLRCPDDWRLGLELGLVNLRAMRLREGLEEILGALYTARRAGEEARFRRVLAAGDRTGCIAGAIDAEGAA